MAGDPDEAAPMLDKAQSSAADDWTPTKKTHIDFHVPHCGDCHGLIEFFGMTPEEAAEVYRWHADHPTHDVCEAELDVIARYEGSGT